MGTWLNSDGLYLKFATDEGTSDHAGGAYCYAEDGSTVVELVLTLADLTETETIQNDVLIIPDNALIQEVVVETLVAAATGTAIDVGTIHISRDAVDAEYTADPDGLLAAFVAASMSHLGERGTFYVGATAGSEESLPASVTTGGALIGTITTAPTLITASRTTSTAFTAGRVLIRVKYKANYLTGTGA